MMSLRFSPDAYHPADSPLTKESFECAESVLGRPRESPAQGRYSFDSYSAFRNATLECNRGWRGQGRAIKVGGAVPPAAISATAKTGISTPGSRETSQGVA